MKLKCDKHNRRVLSVRSNPNFMHRTGDQSMCDSKTASLTDNVTHTVRTYELRDHLVAPGVFALEPISVNKESKPHAKPDTRSYYEAARSNVVRNAS